MFSKMFTTGRYNQCPNCGNTSEGSTIYRCNNCRKLFCSECGGKSQLRSLYESFVSSFLTGRIKMSDAICPFCDNDEKIDSVGKII